jgi:hypothetical protein
MAPKKLVKEFDAAATAKPADHPSSGARPARATFSHKERRS